MRQKLIDEYYMHMALELALRGTGRTTPNPIVGCVLVKDGEVVGRGWHDHLGGLHAEANALRDAGDRARGTTAYVTLEPCSHYGRQPPCAPALVRAGIVRCVAAIGDPNPKVAGRGFSILEDAGISVTRGILAHEAAWQNRGFLSLQTRNRPWVTLKAAVSADASMALANGDSQWITGEEARAAGHLIRSENDVIITGSGTLLHDEPSLTVRYVEGPSPRPAIITAHPDRLAGDHAAIRQGTLVYCPEGAPVPDPLAPHVRRVPAGESGVDLNAVLADIAELGLARVMVEAGARLSSSFIEAGLVDEYHLFAAPEFMGDGRKLTGGITLGSMADVIPFRLRGTRPVGKDIHIEGENPCSLDWLKQLEG